MRRRGVLPLLVGLITGFATAAVADDCFCLVNPSTGAILLGCEAYQRPTDYDATAVCTDPDTGRTAEQTMHGEWQRIEAGTDRCDPCRPQPRGEAPELPRGERTHP